MSISLIQKTLANFGLTSNEITVYLEAVKHTEISPFKLARLTNIPRTTVYDVMTALALKGLITLKTSQGLEKQQTWVVVKNPTVLRDLIWKRKRDLIQLEVDMVDVLPDLKKGYMSHESNTHLQYYSGVEGVKKVYAILDAIPPEVQVYYFDNMMPVDTLGKVFVNKDIERSLKKIHIKKRVKTITPLTDWTRHVLTYQYGRNKSYIEYHEYRYIENTLFNLQHDIYIFMDKVIMICAKEDEVWASILTSKQAAASFISIFQTLWQIAQPITQEFVESLGENEFLREEKKKKIHNTLT